MIKIRKAKNGQYYGVVVAKNGKVLYQSETMKRKQSVLKNIASLYRLFKYHNPRIKDDTI